MTSDEPSASARDACSLAAAEWDEQTAAIARLAAEARSVEERGDGYELVFDADDRIVRRLLEVLATERRCCPFIRFELVFEPQLGPVRLSLRGPDELKSLLRPLLA